MIPTLTLAGAEMLCNAALAEAQRLGLAPLSVAIVAASGKLLLHKAQDGTAGLVPDIALAKAQTCLALNTSSRRLREKYAKDKPTQLAAMGAIAGGQFAPFPGGVLCRDSDGLVLGAIGISGASAEEDEHCGITAANHVGFAPEPTHSSLESKST
ncbi:hypothetical protein CTAYLR_006962 [Chrysophaeum taylorii]|uniref:Heme-binding protein n=1 Tax=Chrysophaeum taylorii TaxID=2483200 RepID=A0AAD7UEG2_9STRA|nr:hypothetical protein CTAYLR_006962 [Chrysophaeum taylorii]